MAEKVYLTVDATSKFRVSNLPNEYHRAYAAHIVSCFVFDGVTYLGQDAEVELQGSKMADDFEVTNLRGGACWVNVKVTHEVLIRPDDSDRVGKIAKRLKFSGDYDGNADHVSIALAKTIIDNVIVNDAK